MPIVTTKFVRKPMHVEGIQVTTRNFREVSDWCQGEIVNADGSSLKYEGVQPNKQYIRVKVHKPQSPRHTQAFVGDWVLYTSKGYKVYTEKALYFNFDMDETNVGVSNSNPDTTI